MRLRDLLYAMDITVHNVSPETEISGISCDSQTVQPGDLFVAVNGTRCDGMCFARQAMQRGAVCVLCGREVMCALPCVAVADPRAALAQLAHRWYNRPDERLSVVGVTGTNGKTTTTYLIRQILQQTLAVPTGLIGTVQNMVGEQILPAQRTTPDALQVQRLLRQMVDSGCGYAVMEVSSHALEQQRVAEMRFDVAVFTNLTEDHLDYHGNMNRYCAAKAKLFRQCRTAVCNADDPWTERLLQGSTCPTVSFGIEQPADLTAQGIRLFSDSVSFTVVSEEERAAVHLRVPGRFSVYNTLGAMASCRALGISLADSAAALETFGGIKGRMEVVPTPGKAYTVLIDYAHTPDALENVLQTARSFTEGRLIAVFGCGGDRESTKRPLMGAIAGRLSDLAIVTSDNPRSEEPAEIIAQILPGLESSGGAYLVESDRRAAIALAMGQAQTGDTVLLCGKGHETYQEIRGACVPLDEREIVRSQL